MTSFYRQRTSQSGGRVEQFYPPPAEASGTPWTITVYSAVHERERWERYCRVANHSYAARGLQAIGEDQVIDIDCYPTYFAEATLTSGADGGDPIGGVRIHSPSPGGRLPLLDELEGYTDIHILRGLVDKLRPHGIIHGGGLWIDPSYSRRGLAGDLARASNAMFAAIQARWYIAATHQYILDAWRSLGWHPIPTIPYFPYPDDRYQSCILLGDRQTWPDDLATWASAQAGDATLDGPGVSDDRPAHAFEERRAIW